MNPNAFIGRKEAPDDAALADALGASKEAWDQLLADLAAESGVNKLEWKSYSAKAGWALRTLRGKRTIVWLGPLAGSFLASFILGDKAIAAAREDASFPAKLMKALEGAERYPEGNGVRLDVKSKRDLPAVKRLVALKIAH